MNRTPERSPSERTPLIIGAVGAVVFVLFTLLAVRSGLGSSVEALSSQINGRLDSARVQAGELRSLGADWETVGSAGRLSVLSRQMTEKMAILRAEQAAASEALTSLREKTRKRAHRTYLQMVDDAFRKQERGLKTVSGVIGEVSAAASAAEALEEASKSYGIALRAGKDRTVAVLQLEVALKTLEEAEAASGRALDKWPGLARLMERHRKVIEAALSTRGTRRELEPVLNGPERFEAESELLRLAPEWEGRWGELAPKLERARAELESARAAAAEAQRFYRERWGEDP